MAGGEFELPPRDKDPLLIDALRLNPKTELGQMRGKEIKDAIDEASASSTDQVGQVADEQRAGLHEIVASRRQLANSLEFLRKLFPKTVGLEEDNEQHKQEDV